MWEVDGEGGYGISITDIAATVGGSRRFIYTWAKRFMQERREGLADKPGRGHQRVLPQPPLTEQHDVCAWRAWA